MQLRRFLLWSLSAILLTFCGCPPAPPSQEKQRQAMSSRWISVEPEEHLEETGPTLLDQDDFDAIVTQVPTISVAIIERTRTGTLTTRRADVEAEVCGTVPEYFHLLENQGRVEVKRGKFLDWSDIETKNEVVVLSESLAEELFDDADPVGQAIELGGRKLVVIGLTSLGAQWASDLTHDAYVPHTLFESNGDPDSPAKYSRFRFKVEKLNDAKTTKELIQRIVEGRHPNEKIRVH